MIPNLKVVHLRPLRVKSGIVERLLKTSFPSTHTLSNGVTHEILLDRRASYVFGRIRPYRIHERTGVKRSFWPTRSVLCNVDGFDKVRYVLGSTEDVL